MAVFIGSQTINIPAVLNINIYVLIIFGSFVAYYFFNKEADRKFSIETITIFIIIFHYGFQLIILTAFIMWIGTMFMNGNKNVSLFKKIADKRNLFVFSKVVIASYLSHVLHFYIEGIFPPQLFIFKVMLIYSFYFLIVEFMNYIGEVLEGKQIVFYSKKEMSHILYTGVAVVLGVHLYESGGMVLTLLLYFFMLPYQNMSRLYKKIQETEEQSYIDELTGAYNMKYFKHIISEKLNSKNQFTFVMMDLDNFKEINDTFGHTAGDKALRVFSDHLKSKTREQDMIFRYAGDEFCLLLPHTTCLDSLTSRLHELTMKIPVTHKGNEFTISTSYGVCEFNSKNKSIEDVFDIADKEMYRQKKKKKQGI